MERAGYHQLSEKSRYYLVIGIGCQQTDHRWFETKAAMDQCIRDEYIRAYTTYECSFRKIACVGLA